MEEPLDVEVGECEGEPGEDEKEGELGARWVRFACLFSRFS